MSVADLANVPTTPEELAWFSFANMAHHRDVNAYIKTKNGILLPEYLLDPLDTAPNTAWSYNHQTMHNNNDAILQVSGYDVTDVDWSNRDSLAGWIWLHYQLHYAEAQASGVW